MLHTRQYRQALVALSVPLLTNLYAEAVTVSDVSLPEYVTPYGVFNVQADTLNLGRAIPTSSIIVFFSPIYHLVPHYS